MHLIQGIIIQNDLEQQSNEPNNDINNNNNNNNNIGATNSDSKNNNMSGDSSNNNISEEVSVSQVETGQEETHIEEDEDEGTSESSPPPQDQTPEENSVEESNDDGASKEEDEDEAETEEDQGKVEEDTEKEEEDEDDKEVEAQAIAAATASADASYTPPVSLLNSPSPYALIRSVDGMSLKKYNPSPSVFTARSVPVALRGKLNVPIHVTVGGSVVEYTVESEDYDISFGVVAEREEGVTVVSAKKRSNTHLNAVTGKFLVGTVPCALIFTFDNEYSWFREKKITYKITIRPPTKENIVAGRKIRAQTALEVVTKDRNQAEERLETASEKRQRFVADVERLGKELEEKKKSLGVVDKEEKWLQQRVQLRSVQEDLLNRRLQNGWEDENSIVGTGTDGSDDKGDEVERAEI